MPVDISGRVPGILCLHQTTRIGKEEPSGMGGNPILHHALELARRGYVTLAPDYQNVFLKLTSSTVEDKFNILEVYRRHPTGRINL